MSIAPPNVRFGLRPTIKWTTPYVGSPTFGDFRYFQPCERGIVRHVSLSGIGACMFAANDDAAACEISNLRASIPMTRCDKSAFRTVDTWAPGARAAAALVLRNATTFQPSDSKWRCSPR
jgi:hypothetical protein